MIGTKWIKVAEKLPNESDGCVLVCMPNEFPYNQGQRVRLGQYSEYAHRWFFDGCCVGGSDPIAWMPLPEPIYDDFDKKQELDKDKLIHEYQRRIDTATKALENATAIIKAQPEVVCCKDCIYWNGGYGNYIMHNWLPCLERDTSADWFCAEGKKADDE